MNESLDDSFLLILLTLICIILCLSIVGCGLYFFLEKNKKKYQPNEIDRVNSSSTAKAAQTTTTSTEKEGTNETIDIEMYKVPKHTLMDGEYENDDIDLEIDDNPETEALYKASPTTQGLAEPMSPNSVSVTYNITPIIRRTPKSLDDEANGIKILRLQSNASSQHDINALQHDYDEEDIYDEPVAL